MIIRQFAGDGYEARLPVALQNKNPNGKMMVISRSSCGGRTSRQPLDPALRHFKVQQQHQSGPATGKGLQPPQAVGIRFELADEAARRELSRLQITRGQDFLPRTVLKPLDLELRADHGQAVVALVGKPTPLRGLQ